MVFYEEQGVHLLRQIQSCCIQFGGTATNTIMLLSGFY